MQPDASRRYQAVIGLEVHAQLRCASKMFCACSTRFGDPPNSNVCPVCLGQPGALPVLNQRAVDCAILFALATGGRVATTSRFARKNYFYPDLPKGYQISQLAQPICEGGSIDARLDGEPRRFELTRAHLEEDAGKSLHEGCGADSSGVDFNRAGTPLLEIVSTPSLHSSDEAMAYLRALRVLVRSLGICDGNMQEGSLRCDANISLRPRGDTALRTRCEIKNLNSVRHVGLALDAEIRRQTALYEAGEPVLQETRLFDEKSRQTRPMRSKEDAQDYRYFDDPDLPPLCIDPARIDRLRASLPELPAARHQRYLDALGLKPDDASLLADEPQAAAYFEAVMEHSEAPPQLAANWVLNELRRSLNERGCTYADSPLPPTGIAELLQLIEHGLISGTVARQVFTLLLDDPQQSARAIVDARGWALSQDDDQLQAVVDTVLRDHASQAASYRAGKKQVLGFLIGKVMAASQGKADPKQAKSLLSQSLDAPAD